MQEKKKIIITFWDKFAEAINEDLCLDNSVRPIVIITSTNFKTYMNKQFFLLIYMMCLCEFRFSKDHKIKKKASTIFNF